MLLDHAKTLLMKLGVAKQVAATHVDQVCAAHACSKLVAS